MGAGRGHGLPRQARPGPHRAWAPGRRRGLRVLLEPPAGDAVQRPELHAGVPQRRGRDDRAQGPLVRFPAYRAELQVLGLSALELPLLRVSWRQLPNPVASFETSRTPSFSPFQAFQREALGNKVASNFSISV